MQRLVQLPTPTSAVEIRDSLSIVARSTLARPEERALATLLLFEGVRVNLFMTAYRMDGWWEGIGGCRRTLDDLAWAETEKVLTIPLSGEDEHMTFAVIIADAMSGLRDRAQALWGAQEMVEELRLACADRARAEVAFREADPVDAAVLRNHFDRATHQQPIPVSRLPLEHPLVLGGHDENSLNQRSSRAIRKLQDNVRRPRPTTLAALIVEMERADA